MKSRKEIKNMFKEWDELLKELNSNDYASNIRLSSLYGRVKGYRNALNWVLKK